MVGSSVGRSTLLHCRDVTVTAGPKAVLREVDLRLDAGEVAVITGPSGVGKTSLLATLAGLRRPASGVLDRRARRQAVVFQEPRLLPWCSISANVGFGVTRGRVDVAGALRTVGLSGVGDALPAELSGGMQQRIALARALVTGPDLLLLDEPFGALHEAGRRELQDVVLAAVAERAMAVLWVTHDRLEAERVADQRWSVITRPDGIATLVAGDRQPGCAQ